MQLQVVVVESKFRHEDAALLLCPDGMLQEHSVGRLDVGPVLERGGEHAVGCSKRTLIRRLRNDAQDVGDEFAVINFIVRGTRCRSSGEGARKINCFVKPLMLLRPTFDVFFRGDELRSCHEDAIVAEIPFRVLEADQSAVILRACLLRFRESARGTTCPRLVSRPCGDDESRLQSYNGISRSLCDTS